MAVSRRVFTPPATGRMDGRRSCQYMHGRMCPAATQQTNTLGLRATRGMHFRLADDKQRLLRQSYDEAATIAHLRKLLEESKGRNHELAEQAECAKARKVAAERRMVALDLHVERIEEKMTQHCATQNEQLRVRPWLCCTCSNSDVSGSVSVMVHGFLFCCMALCQRPGLIEHV